MIQSPDPRVVAKVAFQIAASPYDDQPRIFKQVIGALIEACRKQGWSGQETFDYVSAYGDMIVAHWPQGTRVH
jgi:hypothetical protein